MNWRKANDLFQYPKSHPVVILLAALVVYVSLWLIYPHEFIASDPWAYSQNAFAIAQNFRQFFNNPPNHPFVQRLGITLPVALIYKMLGMNILTTNLWSLCAALIIIVGVYIALPTNRSKVLGVFFCLTSIILFNNSVVLLPDIVCSAFMFISSLLLFNRKKVLGEGMLWFIYPVLSVFFIFIAFMAKESAYWVLPIWIYAAVSDMKEKDHRTIRRFYLPALATGVGLGLSYLVFSYLVWGNPLARFISIQQLSGQHLWSMKNPTLADWIRRLILQPPRMFLSDYGLVTLFAPFAIWFSPKTYRFWIYYTLFTAVFFWFGSTSFTSYQPMPVDARMALPSLPGLFILASIFASYISTSSAISQRVNHVTVLLIVIALICLPFAAFVNSWRGKTLPEATAISIVKSNVLSRKDHRILLICSDARSPESLAFYFGYEYPQNLVVLSAKDFLKGGIEHFNEVYIFLNEQRSMFLKSSNGDKNFDPLIKSLELPPVYTNKGVLLFKTLDSDELLDRLKQSMRSK